jgi:hypothetical protein
VWDDGGRTGPPSAAVPVENPAENGSTPETQQEIIMSKRGRKRRSRKGNAANHGKRPNA